MTQSSLKKALQLLPEKTNTQERDILEKMAAKIPAEDLELFESSLLAETARSHWELSKDRKQGDPKIRIYCPVTKDVTVRRTVIDVVNDDMAFLIDSIVAEINKNNFLIELLVHPFLYAKYDKNGKLTDISSEETEGYLRQSHIHIHIVDTLSDEALAALEAGLYKVIRDVQIANKDWKKLLEKLRETREELAGAKTGHSLKEVEQYCAFLDYLYNNNFTLLGYREYEFTESDKGLKSKTVSGSSLGLLHDGVRPAYISENKEGLPRNLQEMRRDLPPVSVSKTNRLSTVHRRVPMDAIAVKTYGKDGRVIGEKLFLGLFTSVTYSRSVSDVPFLREKVDDVMELSGFIPGSHDRKALRHILEKYPRDELFQIPKDELLKIATSILRLQERQRIALFIRRDPFGRYISCLVYIPRDRFGTELRKQMATILEEELHGVCQTFTTSLDDSVFARVMFTINISQKTQPEFDPEKIEKRLQDAGKTWPELLSSALALELKNADEREITRLTLKYGEAFPVAYMSRYEARQSVFDIEKIEKTLGTQTLQLDLYRLDSLEKNQMRLKVYIPGRPLTLSDVMPILENMGLKAVSELPYEIKPAGGKASLWIHDFLLETPKDSATIDIPAVKENFETAFVKIWCGLVKSDGLNRLVLTANMDWQETIILRTYVRYIKQIRYPFSRPYIEAALNQYPKISRMLVDFFKALHDPAQQKKTGNDDAAKFISKINKELEKVESLDQDRILRSISALIDATLRTNYFQTMPDGQPKPYLSIKLDSSKVPELPNPRPYREIFVYSPRVEGIHLRGDKIARGGLRWSDRHEDFRTEVLGLMKAQMVKNSVIVPMGAKGGFVVKTAIQDRAKYREEGVECYKMFIRGLLDITDNREGEKIIPPKDVVRRDGDDPYLVVAADKGTASFSDTANGISQEYGFWLGDAFASGGSAGYDHKKMGITARGAWESVKLHFRQLNHNTQTQPFDVAGVGDMSGDVFGNGMLLSEHIRLLAAFNHLHIFCDPDPDPAVTYKERKRLFENVLGWDGYDQKLLSKGGRIYSRSEKTLKLTPEIQKAFDIEADQVTPNELMRAILKSRVDLLWFGGIGTYIKSSKETHADVGDKATDAIRINAADVRARVVGEGANLGVTQLGRIEFAQKGGKINTDFLDNSGGVDSSDHEVNIKILLSEIVASNAHKMDIAARNKLLEKMTEDIAAHVLRNNYQQAQAISLAEIQASENLERHEEFIRQLERENGLNRTIEGLPDTEQVEERLRLGKGLTRPELCILLSYSKITFTQALLACDIPDDPQMRDWLLNYFPAPLRESFAPEIQKHRLAREIVATTMANSLINRMGPTFLKTKMSKTGASCSQVAKAYIVVRDAYNLRSLWDSIESLDNKVPAEVQLKAMREIVHLAEHAIGWFLTRLGRDIDIGEDIKAFGDGISTLYQKADKLLPKDMKETLQQHIQAGEHDGLPSALARQIALMPILSSACDIVRIALEQKTDLAETAQTYFEIGGVFHMDWLRKQARFLPADDQWQSEATNGLVDQLYSAQAALTIRVLRDTAGKAGKGLSLWQTWAGIQNGKVERLEPVFDSIRNVGTVDLPMLIIAEQRLRGLAGD